MLEGFVGLFAPRPFGEVLRDLVDILLVAYTIYRLLLLVRGTGALQVGQGLALVALVYLAAQRLGLATTYTLLDRVLTSFLLLVVVVFQADIRRALMGVGNRPWLLGWRPAEDTDSVDEVVSAVTQLAERHIGALIVFERGATLDDFVQQATRLDARVSQELIYTLFLPGHENPLHDGAVLIRDARVLSAGAFLPLTTAIDLDRHLGTRHRAAMGISEQTDAVVVVVSEERGEISLCFNGNIIRRLNASSLRQALYGIFYSKRRAAALLKRGVDAEARVSRLRISNPPPPPPPAARPPLDPQPPAKPEGER